MYAPIFVVALDRVVVGTTVVVDGVVVAIVIVVIVTSACATWRWRGYPRHTTRRSSAMTLHPERKGQDRW